MLSSATGFVVAHQQRYFLITNWHVLVGRHPETGQPMSPTAGLPDQVRIGHHLKRKLGAWMFVREALLDLDGSPRWVTHPYGAEVDVAALELGNIPPDVQLFPLDLALADADLVTYPAMPVSVIGFPQGIRANQLFAIWKTGHIATDPDLPYGGRPAFLIDATTRGGMSGSPVVARSHGGYMSHVGIRVITAGVVTKFLGVYASRIHPKDVEIGCVWRPSAILEVLDHAVAR